jgi:AraC-like DNA-binding protein
MSIHNELVFRNPVPHPLGNITVAGYLTNRSGRPAHAMRTLRSFAVAYLLEGQGNYTTGKGAMRPLTAGDLLLIIPGVQHQYGPGRGQFWREFYIVFEGPIFELWRKAGLLDGLQPVYRLTPIHFWQVRLAKIAGGAAAPTPLRRICQLQEFLSDVLAQQPGVTDADREWFRRASAMIESVTPGQSPDWYEIATQCGTGYELFRKKFTRVAGVAPARFRAVCVMKQACELMGQRDLATAEISRKLGFANEFHFSRRFKQIAGCSPTVFRRSLPG